MSIYIGAYSRALMKNRVLLAFALLNLSLVGGAQVLTANAELALAASARDKGDYPTALEHAQRAVVLDPGVTEAHFAVGTIADLMCLPNAEPGPNEPLCRLAVQEYKKVLELDSSDTEALRSLAFLLSQFGGNLDESESYYRKDFAPHPNDPEVLCAIAAIDEQHSWSDVALARAGVESASTKLIDSPSCNAARATNQARIDEAIALLLKALEVRSNSDLMGFLSVLYFTRAQIQCGNRRAYRSDMDAAKAWDRKRKEIWRRKTPEPLFRRCPPGPPPMPGNE